MTHRRQFLKTALMGALVIHFPLLAIANQSVVSTTLYHQFGALPEGDEIKTVLSVGPVADLFLLSMVPQKLLGFASLHLTPKQKTFLPDSVRNLPITGRLMGRGTTASLESIIALKPDIIIDIGNRQPSQLDTAKRVHEQTRLPYVIIDGAFAKTAEQLKVLGQLVGTPDRGNELAQFAEKLLQETAQLAQKSQQQHGGEILTIYSGRGADGLEIGLPGSIHTDVIDWLGIKSAVDIQGENRMMRVSMEQMMLWQPDVLITLDRHFYQRLQKDPLWQRINAVKNQRYYLVPNLPFGWTDQPPSVNRLLGLAWLAHILYPALFTQEHYQKTVIEYFALFYQYDLSPEDLSQLSFSENIDYMGKGTGMKPGNGRGSREMMEQRRQLKMQGGF